MLKRFHVLTCFDEIVEINSFMLDQTMEDHWMESLRTKFVNTDTSTLKQLLLSKAEIIDEIKRNQNQRFNGELCYL